MNIILADKKEYFLDSMFDKLNRYNLGVKTDFDFNYTLRILLENLIEWIEQLKEFQSKNGVILKPELEKELANLLTYGEYGRDCKEKIDLRDLLIELYYELTETNDNNLFLDCFSF